ncbi:MAG: hypothetical protein M1119_05875 [Firmicutes bacterium]|nr:hypothetical protein [Bacillota bacterium]
MSEQMLLQILEELKLLNHKVGSLEHKVDNLELRQKEMKSDIAELKKGQLRLETRMENEVIEKIRGLSDGYSLRGDQIENLLKHLNERFDIISHDINYLKRNAARQEAEICELKKVK